MTHHKTRRLRLGWLNPPDLAEKLGITRETARLLIRRIPGAELLYRTESGREKWRVSTANYDAYRLALAKSA